MRIRIGAVLALSMVIGGCQGIPKTVETTLSTGQKVAFSTNRTPELVTTAVSMQETPGSVFRPVATHSGTGMGNVLLGGLMGVASSATGAALLRPGAPGNTVVGNGAFVINATGGGGGDATSTSN